jgi:hypothetical protein
MLKSQNGRNDAGLKPKPLKSRYRLHSPAPASEILSRISLMNLELYSHLCAAHKHFERVNVIELQLYAFDSDSHEQGSLI